MDYEKILGLGGSRARCTITEEQCTSLLKVHVPNLDDMAYANRDMEVQIIYGVDAPIEAAH